MDRRVRLLLLVTGAIALAVLLLGRSRGPQPASEPPPPEPPPVVHIDPEPGPPKPPTVDPPVPFVTGAGPHPIEKGRTLGIEAADLPQTPLLLDLRIPADVIPPEPLVKVTAPDGRVLETLGSATDPADGLRLAIDPAWLTPGRYVIEVRTLDRSHLPLRRFALLVR